MAEGLLERLNIAEGFVPVDMQTTANDGDWVSLRDYKRVLCVVFKGAGTAGDDPVITLRQAQDNGGTGAKALDFTVIHEKVGTATEWTRQTQSASNTYTNAASAEAKGIFAVEIQRTDLDIANGFTHVQLQVPDVGGNAQLGCGFYVLAEADHMRQGPADPTD